MQYQKILVVFGIAVFISACSKQETAKTEEEDCVTRASSQNGEPIEGQYIVVYRTSDQERSIPAGTAARSVLSKNNISETAIRETIPGDLGGFVATLTREEAARLKSDEDIAAIEQDRIIALSTCFKVVAPSLITWNINRVGYGDGTGKTAWIIDTGIDFEHSDLNVDVTRSRSFISGEPSADDENGHGTHVAGIIGAKNNNYGTLGVASGARVVALKVLGRNGMGTLSGIIQALAYVNANGKAGDVINMSLGEEEPSQILDEHVQNTASKGILISIAAGNDSKPANSFSPGRANGLNIFTVSATDSLDYFAVFSNYGNDVVDFAAPGVRILSTYHGDRYARMSGTSMAAPHVAGLLLLNGRNIKASGRAKNDPDGTADAIAHQ
jgi:subtilisin